MRRTDHGDSETDSIWKLKFTERSPDDPDNWRRRYTRNSTQRFRAGEQLRPEESRYRRVVYVRVQYNLIRAVSAFRELSKPVRELRIPFSDSL